MTQSKWIVIGLLAVAVTAWPALAQTTQPAGPEQPELRPSDQPKDVTKPAEAPPSPGQGQPATQPGGQQAPPPRGPDMSFIWIMLGVMVLLYIWMGRNRRKQEAKRKEMLSTLKKGDKITSIGGIIGTVIESRETEVVVKVDESNNVRLRFARWAIRGVGEEAKAEKPEDRDQQQPQKQ
ncbi:MAG: preprotein translocase subunit YajC [Planctomycetes bacterium ADurb.Bin126]|nr:MAG: preprotein translocase subunit YajC [Planctomycetes bacterium ADurb.Bin126]HOD80065.1 preprotein translocase subunit YajC [Phycisphaerae bacterium]HQL73154.1 preprotein translocase subunit YajC [Phycisphaerae bacterium]